VSILELNVKNLSKTLLTQDIGLTETSFKVADAGALPNPPFLITVEGEIMRVGSKNVSTNTLSNVLRGREGTSPTPHSSGTVVENRFTAGTYDEIKQTVTSCNDALTSHSAESATTSQEGHVQLSSSTSSTSTSLAATASAVKTVNDALNAHKAEKATETKLGHIKLSDIPQSDGKRVARFVVGTSTSGWTQDDVDYLCDGTNDQEEIIQALTALPATGGEIVILDGIYNITASINVPKDNVSLRGNGNATILKRMYNSTSADSGPTAGGLITLNGKSGCKIQGLQIDGNKATYTASYNYGIRLQSSNNNTVTGNTCNNNYYDGIQLSSSSSDNAVTGNTCNNNNYNGIRLHSSNNNTVTGNTCNNNSYSYGICLYSSSSDNTVTGNTCNNNIDGIHLYSSSSDNAVIGNTCSNNNNGIRLQSSNNNTVTGNTCNNNNYGIRLFSSSNNTVTGNTCIRGIGTPENYTTDQHTICLSSIGNDYNLISSNNCMGKAVVVEGGTGNSAWGNKYDSGNDLP
jgi:parallel beta-helix repeat protein